MNNTENTTDNADAKKVIETVQQDELSAEELAKIAGGDIYMQPHKGIS